MGLGNLLLFQMKEQLITSSGTRTYFSAWGYVSTGIMVIALGGLGYVVYNQSTKSSAPVRSRL